MDGLGDTPISILPSVSKISSYYWQQMHFPCHVCRPTVQPCPTSSTRLEASNNVWKTLKETRLASARIAPTSPWRKKKTAKNHPKISEIQKSSTHIQTKCLSKIKNCHSIIQWSFLCKNFLSHWLLSRLLTQSWPQILGLYSLNKKSMIWCQKTARAQGPCMVA